MPMLKNCRGRKESLKDLLLQKAEEYKGVFTKRNLKELARCLTDASRGKKKFSPRKIHRLLKEQRRSVNGNNGAVNGIVATPYLQRRNNRNCVS